MRPSLRPAALSTAALFLAACAASVAEPDVNIGPRITTTPLGSDGRPLTAYSAIDTAARVVVRDAARWQAQWNTIWGRTTPVPALPAVDFTREMVVVAAMGGRSNGGYTIRIDSVTASAGLTPGGGALVWVSSTSPGPRCVTTQALTAPVDAVRMPLVGGPINFHERALVTNCQ